MASLHLRPLTRSEAEEISRWAYEPPFDLYDGDPTKADDLLQRDSSGPLYYGVSLRSEDQIVGFCCFSEAARVPPQMAVVGTLDVGLGVRPDRVSKGIGTRIVPVILDYASKRWAPERFRVAVAEFNERSLRLCLKAGFVEKSRFTNTRGLEFVELILPLDAIGK